MDIITSSYNVVALTKQEGKRGQSSTMIMEDDKE